MNFKDTRRMIGANGKICINAISVDLVVFSLKARSHLELRKVSIHRSVNLTDSIGTQPVRLR